MKAVLFCCTIPRLHPGKPESAGARRCLNQVSPFLLSEKKQRRPLDSLEKTSPALKLVILALELLFSQNKLEDI